MCSYTNKAIGDGRLYPRHHLISWSSCSPAATKSHYSPYDPVQLSALVPTIVQPLTHAVLPQHQEAFTLQRTLSNPSVDVNTQKTNKQTNSVTTTLRLLLMGSEVIKSGKIHEPIYITYTHSNVACSYNYKLIKADLQISVSAKYLLGNRTIYLFR